MLIFVILLCAFLISSRIVYSLQRFFDLTGIVNGKVISFVYILTFVRRFNSDLQVYFWQSGSIWIEHPGGGPEARLAFMIFQINTWKINSWLILQTHTPRITHAKIKPFSQRMIYGYNIHFFYIINEIELYASLSPTESQ